MHLNTDVALDFLEGRLDKDQQTYWERHMHTCTECSENVAHWRDIGSGLKRLHLRNAPSGDLQRAVQIFQPRPQEARKPFRSIVAAIVFDSYLQPSLAGVRGSSSAQTRQLVMRADEFDIHIKIWGELDNRQMLGQLLSRTDQDFSQAARFHLLRNGERIESTITDEMGAFQFADVPEGNLSLQIDLPNLTVIGALSMREAI
jgi:hypothetical protein